MSRKRKQRTEPEATRSPHLARCRELAARSGFDLKLTWDAASAARIDETQLSRISRERAEISALLRELEKAAPSSKAETSGEACRGRRRLV